MNFKQKRAHFPKDLDKLVSGDYVLVPKESAQFCAEKLLTMSMTIFVSLVKTLNLKPNGKPMLMH